MQMQNGLAGGPMTTADLTERMLAEQIASLVVGKARSDANGARLSAELMRLREIAATQAKEIERLKGMIPDTPLPLADPLVDAAAGAGATAAAPAPAADKPKRIRRTKAEIEAARMAEAGMLADAERAQANGLAHA